MVWGQDRVSLRSSLATRTTVQRGAQRLPTPLNLHWDLKINHSPPQIQDPKTEGASWD